MVTAEQQARTTLADWIEQHGIEADAEQIHGSERANSADWGLGSMHFRVTLTANGESMTVYFSQGSAVTGWPDAETVLDCLANDISMVEQYEDRWDWMDAMGEWSGGQSEAWDTIHEQAKDLTRLVGRDALETLLYSVERL